MRQISRRQFLKKTIRSTAGATMVTTALASAAGRIRGANDKVVLALIGAGGRGSLVIQNMTAFENVETKYICEVDDSRGAGAIKSCERLQGYAPKRVTEMKEVFDDKDIDGVVIATPEHWHALATVWACQAGKDVYVEKNIAKTIWEGRKMVEAARKYKRIVQGGTQNRSAPYGLTARDYIKSGKIGKVVRVKVYNMQSGRPWKPPPDSPVPQGLVWDRWLGPAPDAPYNSNRHHSVNSYWDYSGGLLAAGGCHQLDFARVVLDNPPHPKAVYCAGGRLAFDDNCEMPDTQAITWDFGDFLMTCDSTTFIPYMKKSQGDVRFGDKFPFWPQNSTRIEIYGTEAMMYVGRMGGGWQVLKGDGKVVDYEYGRYPDKLHQQNFIDCIRSRELPNGDIEQCHYSSTLAHLGNLSYRVGKKQLLFDVKSETFTNNNDANNLLKPQYRKHYRIPDEV